MRRIFGQGLWLVAWEFDEGKVCTGENPQTELPSFAREDPGSRPTRSGTPAAKSDLPESRAATGRWDRVPELLAFGFFGKFNHFLLGRHARHGFFLPLGTVI